LGCAPSARLAAKPREEVAVERQDALGFIEPVPRHELRPERQFGAREGFARVVRLVAVPGRLGQLLLHQLA
jgi:hypothetical protein